MVYYVIGIIIGIMVGVLWFVSGTEQEMKNSPGSVQVAGNYNSGEEKSKRKLADDIISSGLINTPLFENIEYKREAGPNMVFLSPEGFERLQKGELTKPELLGIKKAVDKAAEAKTKYAEEK